MDNNPEPSSIAIRNRDSTSDDMLNIKARFSEALKCPQAPSETMLTLLKRILAPWKDKLQDIKRTINILNLTLAMLHRQQDQIKTFVSSFDPLFAPIRRLPEDVLAEIFHHCIPTHRNPIPVTSESPLVLTLVCRQWRSVALSSPKLWTKVHAPFQLNVTEGPYDPDRLFAERWPLRLAGLKAWLSRSHDLPLSISVKGAVLGMLDHESQQIQREIFQLMVVDQASRLRCLELCLPMYAMRTLHNMFDISHSTLPKLCFLRVVEEDGPLRIFRATVGFQADPRTPRPLHSWLELPTLQDVHMGLRSLPLYSATAAMQIVDTPAPIPSPSLIRCSQITRFSLYFPTDRRIIQDVLRCLPLLEVCHLSVSPEDSSPTTDFGPITLPKLQHLTIEREEDPDSLHPETSGTLFQLLDAPYLVSLVLLPAPHNGPHVIPFLKRFPSLEKFTFNPCALSNRELLQMLNTIPQITQLIIDHRYRKEDLYWSSKERPVPRSVRPSECKHLDTYRSFFNQDVEATEMPWDHQASTTASRDLLVPNLTSFTTIMKIGIGNRDEFAVDLLEFLKSRIHPHPVSSVPFLSTTSGHPTASLESVTLVLDGHPEMRTDTEVDIPLDLAAEVARHVESVGRVIGEDIFLDISYPWKKLYELQGKQKWKVPDVLLSAKEGLDKQTDCTWPFCDE